MSELLQSNNRYRPNYTERPTNSFRFLRGQEIYGEAEGQKPTLHDEIVIRPADESTVLFGYICTDS